MPLPDLTPPLLALAIAVTLAPALLLFLVQHYRHQRRLLLLEDELTARSTALHALEVSEARLQTRLQAGTQMLEQALAELRAHKQLVHQLRQHLEQLGKQHQSADATIHGQASEISALRERIQELRAQFAAQEAQHARLQQDYQTQSNTQRALQTELEQRERHFAEQFALLADTRQTLSTEFENLAHRIFEEKGRHFAATSQTSIDQLLQPFRQQIDGFQQRINEIHDVSLKESSQLGAEIRKVLDIGLQMSQEANNLSSALKGNSQQRGAWGEAQLRRTLEMSGLSEDTHFAVQTAFKNESGEQRQTDYLIKLPDNKHIVIDSKVSLLAYDRAVGAETPEAWQLAIDEHVRAVRQHIDDLASKDYANLSRIDSPSFVLMFMPIEPAYIEALKHNKDLFDYGYRKGVVLVSHTTLIPILRTVANLWMLERSNSEAREISARAGELYNQVCLIAERLGKLGNSLGTVSKHYNDTVRALSGKQGLYGKVERFEQLSTRISKSLPALETQQLDFETERLSLLVGTDTEQPSGSNAPEAS